MGDNKRTILELNSELRREGDIMSDDKIIQIFKSKKGERVAEITQNEREKYDVWQERSMGTLLTRLNKCGTGEGKTGVSP